MAEAPRSADQRKKDTLARLETDVDGWFATADPESGLPYMMPLSYLWDGSTLIIATNGANPTACNIAATGRVRVGIGPTRDLILIDGEVSVVEEGELSEKDYELFAEHTGFDPRKSKGMVYYRVRPLNLQAWREANELKGRDLIVDGEWLV